MSLIATLVMCILPKFKKRERNRLKNPKKLGKFTALQEMLKEQDTRQKLGSTQSNEQIQKRCIHTPTKLSNKLPELTQPAQLESANFYYYLSPKTPEVDKDILFFCQYEEAEITKKIFTRTRYRHYFFCRTA